jgi:hypothetical protein
MKPQNRGALFFATTVSVCTALCLASYLSIARADILFFDLNDNATELAAAERAAAARGEKLINVPLVDDETKDKVREAQRAVDRADRAVRMACSQQASPGDTCGAAKKTLDAQNRAYNAVASKIKPFGGDELMSAISNIKKKNPDVSSIVISGHDGDREYWGTYGHFFDDDLEDALVANQPMGQNLRSLYLWGCNTGITDDFNRKWKRAFPASTMIAGFDGQAPLGSRAASSALLEDLMVKENQLRETRDRDEIRDIFNSLSDVNGSNVAVCLNRETIASRKGVRSPEDDNQLCDSTNQNEIKYNEIFECYLEARPGCEVIAQATDETNILRRVYNYAQETKHCYFVNEKEHTERKLVPIEVRNLLFDNYIRKTFEHVYQSELEAFNALLAKLGFPPELRMKGIGEMSRGQYLARVRAIKNEWNNRARPLTDNEGRIRDAGLLAVGNYLGAIDMLQKRECIPGSWLETRGPYQDSACGADSGGTMRERMANAVSDAEQAVASYPH